MNATSVLEFLAAIFALVAAVFIFDQHLHRPRPFKLMWSLGLLFYGIAAAAAGAGAASSWTVGDYKTWYYFGGVLTAAFLGLGSFYLLGPRRWANVLTGIAVVIAIYAAVRIATFAVPATTAQTMRTLDTLDVTNTRAFTIFPFDIELCAIVMNIPGALLLFGGAVWSAWRFWRAHAPAYRLASMVLLALGAVFPSFLTGFQALGHSGGAALGEFLGALFLFAGLLVSLDVFTVFRVPFTRIILHERRPAVQASPR